VPELVDTNGNRVIATLQRSGTSVTFGYRVVNEEIAAGRPDFAQEEATVAKLIAALKRGMVGEVFAANEAAYEWLQSPFASWQPRFEMAAAEPGSPPAIAMLEFDAAIQLSPAERVGWLSRNIAHLLFRPPLFGGFCVALARYFAGSGLLAEAIRLNDVALKVAPHHVLRNQHDALVLAAEAKPVPPILVRYLGDDDKYLDRFICREPFERFDLHDDGAVGVCCGFWTPDFFIGDAFKNSAAEILNSERAIAMRRSVTEGTFDYCDLTKCMLFGNDTQVRKDNTDDPVLRRAIEQGIYEVEAAKTVLLSFDRTCNLSCPSCRSEVIVEPPELRDYKMAYVEDSILPLLKKAQFVNFNVAGELLVSKPSRLLLNRLNRADFPDLQIDIITNGTLFGPKQWAAFPNIHGMVRTIRVSVDGATAGTVEKLRRGAKWPILRQNLEFLGSLYREGKIKAFYISCTYQLDNFHEMPAFVQLGRELGVVGIIFEKMESGPRTQEEYLPLAVHLGQHPQHAEFLKVIRHPDLGDPMVSFDLAYLRQEAGGDG
jgi:hypothetical protein